MDLEAKRAKRARVLAERAELLARQSEKERDTDDQLEAVLCMVGSETFALPVELLREIVPLPPITPLPSCPSWVLGIAHIRGTLLSVVDLAQVCRAKGEGPAEHVVVVQSPRGPLGLAVGKVLSSDLIDLSKLTTQDDRSERRASLGVTPALAVLLDVKALLTLPELVVQ